MKPLWNRQQFPVPCDEAPAVDRRRADEVPLQTQPAAEVDSPGFFGNEGIRPPFQQKPLLPYGMDEAPQATACFEQVQADGLVQSGSSVQDAVSSGQPEIPPPITTSRYAGFKLEFMGDSMTFGEGCGNPCGRQINTIEAV